MTEPDLSTVFGAAATAERREKMGGILPRRSGSSASTSTSSHDGGQDQDQAAEAAPQQEDAGQTSGAVVEPTAIDQPAEPPAEPTVEPAEPAEAETVNEAPRPPTADNGLTVPVSVYMRPDAVAAARRRRRGGRQRLSHADIALDAIEANRDRLAELVAARHSAPARPAGALFPARAPRQRGGDGGPRRILWTIFLTDAELRIIDRLAAQAGAASRSELISAAVEAQLLPRGRRR